MVGHCPDRGKVAWKKLESVGTRSDRRDVARQGGLLALSAFNSRYPSRLLSRRIAESRPLPWLGFRKSRWKSRVAMLVESSTDP